VVAVKLIEVPITVLDTLVPTVIVPVAFSAVALGVLIPTPLNADIVLTSQYDISTTTNILTLNFIPVVGARLDVTKRTSKQWYIGNVLQEGSDEIIDLVI
jgi:hypothetical protein